MEITLHEARRIVRLVFLTLALGTKKMRVSLYEAKFGVDLTIQQIGTIVEALIDIAQKDMDKHPRSAKDILDFAKELRDSMAAGLDEQKRSFLDTQIKMRLEALDD